MKRLSEIKQERCEKRAEQRKRYEEAVNIVLEKSAAIPLHEKATLDSRNQARESLVMEIIYLIGIACDICGTELCSDNYLLLTSPPKKRVICVGCGCIDYICEYEIL